MADGQERIMVENSLLNEANLSLPENGPRWTPEQEDAIYSRGCDILVAAGAGAGKTAVLVERVIQGLLRENGLDIERLLVVTFTEAAAAEMRSGSETLWRRNCGKSPATPGCSSKGPPAVGLYLYYPCFCSRPSDGISIISVWTPALGL